MDNSEQITKELKHLKDVLKEVDSRLDNIEKLLQILANNGKTISHIEKAVHSIESVVSMIRSRIR